MHCDNSSPLQAALQGEIRVSAGMPERHDLDSSRLVFQAVVKVVPNLAQMNAAHTWQFDVGRRRSYVRLSPNELECLLDGVAKSIRSSGSILIPPF